MGKEIERKWIVKAYPKDIHTFKHWRIEQIYINLSPEVRLRKKTDIDTHAIDYKLTVKSQGTLERSEFEIPVDELIWNEGLAAAGTPIVKDYYKFERDGIIYEMSLVDNKFIYIEVEFETIEEAKQFVFPWPDLVLLDATEESAYKMKNYWVNREIPILTTPNG